jgi:hypothetical protein
MKKKKPTGKYDVIAGSKRLIHILVMRGLDCPLTLNPYRSDYLRLE